MVRLGDIKAGLKPLRQFVFSMVAITALVMSVIPAQAVFAEEHGEGTSDRVVIVSVVNSPDLTIHWLEVVGADHYNVYRESELIETTTATQFTDTSSPDGNYWFHITSVDSEGVESEPASVQATIDNTGPTLTYTTSPAPNAAGWYTGARVRILFTCTDPGGIQYCSDSPKFVSVEGMDQEVVGTGTDNHGNTSTLTVSINLDKSTPEIQSLELSKNPKKENETATLVAHATDAMAGIVGGEYFIGNDDPGFGQATPMPMVDGNPTVTIGTDLALGSHLIYVRVQDAAGNWNQATGIWLNVTPYIEAPNLISATRQANDTVALEWESTENAHHYNVYRDGQLIGSTEGTSFTAPAMAYGTYYYHVAAANADESYVSNPSNTIDVTISEPVPVDQITTNGNKYFVPSVANGDVLPGLGTNNINVATYSFAISNDASGAVVAGDFDFSFTGGPLYCMILPMLSGCQRLSLSAQTVSSLTFGGDNYATGTFIGTASVTVNGVTTTNPFLVEGIDGNRIDSSAQDKVTIKIFAPDEDPQSATPLYQVAGRSVSRSQIAVQ